MEFESAPRASYTKALSDDMVHVGLVSKEEKVQTKSWICTFFQNKYNLFMMVLFLFACFALFASNVLINRTEHSSAKTLESTKPGQSSLPEQFPVHREGVGVKKVRKETSEPEILMEKTWWKVLGLYKRIKNRKGDASATLFEDGTVECSGNARTGGDPGEKRAQLTNVESITAAWNAFAAKKRDGTVIVWGFPEWGGNPGEKQADLTDVESITATNNAFAAKKRDGTVIAWGSSHNGGNPGEKQVELTDVESITAAIRAFAAKKRDGTVIAWGAPKWGGDPGEKQADLTDVESITAAKFAFAAKKRDGSVIVWGHPKGGGDPGEKQTELTDVESLTAADNAFAAKKRDGTVIVWGRPDDGGDPGDKQAELTEIEFITAAGNAFAAKKRDGNVIVWGREEDQPEAVQKLFQNQDVANRLNEKTGGVFTKSGEPVPLKGVKIQADVYGFVADVMTNLTFVSTFEDPLEVKLVLPLDIDSAVYRVESFCERHLIAKIKDKRVAREEYKKAVEEGRQATLVEEDDNHPDVITIELGNMKPGKQCWVIFSFIHDLELLPYKPELRFTYPIVLGERYVSPLDDTDGSGPQSEVTASMQRLKKEDIPYTWDFNLTVHKPLDVEIEPRGTLNWKIAGSKAILHPGQSLNENFDILIRHKPPLAPFEIIEPGKNPKECDSLSEGDSVDWKSYLDNSVAMLNFLPQFEQTLIRDQEYLLFVDSSGSMHGDRIQQAKETAVAFVNLLPEEATFNIVWFSFGYLSAFEESRQATKINKDEAIYQINSIIADGGTELMSALQENVFKREPKKGTQRQVFVMTDGQVSRTSDILEEAKRSRLQNRFFTFGIGHGASSELVKGLASVTGGRAKMLSTEDDLNVEVLRVLHGSQSSFYDGIKIEFQLREGLCAKVIHVDNHILPNEIFEIFAEIRGPIPFDGNFGMAMLSGVEYSRDGAEAFQFELPLLVSQKSLLKSLPIHRIAAKRQITRLNPKNERKSPGYIDGVNLVKEISIASNVLSPLTSFIAVDYESTPTDGERKRVNVPLVQESGNKQAETSLFSAETAHGAPHLPNIGSPAYSATPQSRSIGSSRRDRGEVAEMAARRARERAANVPERAERAWTPERGERAERTERSQRGMRGERAELGARAYDPAYRGERGMSGERGERGERAVRGERRERAERADRGVRGDRGNANPMPISMVAMSTNSEAEEENKVMQMAAPVSECTCLKSWSYYVDGELYQDCDFRTYSQYGRDLIFECQIIHPIASCPNILRSSGREENGKFYLQCQPETCELTKDITNTVVESKRWSNCDKISASQLRLMIGSQLYTVITCDNISASVTVSTDRCLEIGLLQGNVVKDRKLFWSKAESVGLEVKIGPTMFTLELSLTDARNTYRVQQIFNLPVKDYLEAHNLGL